ncbi:MAG: hypothetical protein GF375_00475 [Candidatus Omnitrophica bacterium]|nr:hypothetical protein [Candidatus Omnitrophota bacterium]
MGLSKKFKAWAIRRQVEIQKGKSQLQKDKEERLKRKSEKLANMKPSARKAIVEGLATRKGPIQVMKEEYARRKYEREKNK